MEEYIWLEEEKARRRAIVLNDALTSEVMLLCEPMVSPLNNNKIDFRILFDESDDEDYTMIYDKNSFSYKIIFVDDLKTDSENDKVNMPLPKPRTSYFNDLDFFKDFENEFPAIVYIDALTDENDVETEVPPKTAQAILARQKEKKARSIMLLAIPDEYQLRFHTIKDAKSLWAAIKSSLLEIHGATVSNEDANQKFLRALPSSRNNIALIMRNKEGIDELDIDDLYSNLKVFEADIKGSYRSYSNSQNVAFLSVEDTNSINELNTANGVSTAAYHNSSGQASSSSYTDDLKFSFFASQSNSPQLDDEDLEQIDHDDLEEINLKWQVAMLSMRVKRFYKKTGRKGVEHQEIKGTGIEMQDGLGYDWSYIAQEEPTEFALMAYTSGSDTEKNKVAYEEKIAILEFEVKDKGNAITRLTNQLDQTLKEKEDLKAKLERFEISSKNLNKLINSQLSAKDKTGLGYGDQLSESNSEVLPSVFDSCSSDGDDNPTNDRFKKGNGYHAVPLPLTGNYMPPLADLSFARLGDSVYRPTTNKASASISKGEPCVINTSNISVEMPKVDSVRTSEVIIKDWVSDDEDTLVDIQVDSQTIVKPSFKKIEFTKARNEAVKSDK
nr:ribonuclease H-like domain-containing protein [Tanacetum cinerariifolium]